MGFGSPSAPPAPPPPPTPAQTQAQENASSNAAATQAQDAAAVAVGPEQLNKPKVQNGILGIPVLLGPNEMQSLYGE